MRSPTPRAALRATLFLVAIVMSAACAAKSTSASGTTARRDSEVMDSTDIRGHNYSTVYDAISAQHANWLLPRGGPTGQRAPELGVWIGGRTTSVGVEYLRQMRPVDVKEIRRLSTTESLHTYSWPWGGLVITLR